MAVLEPEGGSPMHLAHRHADLTVADLESLAAKGTLHENDRVELIGGRLFDMTPVGAEHIGCVIHLEREFHRAFDGVAVTSVQNPVELDGSNMPCPDIALLVQRDDAYRSARPRTEDVLLVVEVSDSTLKFDMQVKVPRYAAAGIPEVWIVDLTDGRLRRFLDPHDSEYSAVEMCEPGDTVVVQAFPEATFRVSEILGLSSSRSGAARAADEGS